MPSWKNDKQHWGWGFILIHWLMALTVFGLYAVGWYMVDLDYYDTWYRTAPFWHKSIGVILFLFLIVRLVLRMVMGVPGHLASHAVWEVRIASIAHTALYLLLFVACVSGYLISTADGRGVSVFTWFEVPALISDVDNLEDLAGEVHEMVTDGLLLLALFHAAGALKHHFLDKDATLRRMLGLS